MQAKLSAQQSMSSTAPASAYEPLLTAQAHKNTHTRSRHIHQTAVHKLQQVKNCDSSCVLAGCNSTEMQHVHVTAYVSALGALQVLQLVSTLLLLHHSYQG